MDGVRDVLDAQMGWMLNGGELPLHLGWWVAARRCWIEQATQGEEMEIDEGVMLLALFRSPASGKRSKWCASPWRCIQLAGMQGMIFSSASEHVASHSWYEK